MGPEKLRRPVECRFPLAARFKAAIFGELHGHGAYGGHMRRRDFITLFDGTAAAWPLVVRAQQPDKFYRIAFVSPSRPVSEISETGFYATFFKELRRLGYVDGKNLVVLRFSAEGDTSRYDPIVRDVVSASPDVVFTANNPLVLRFKALVHSIPVVALMGDPLAFGIVAGLARPDANITGISGGGRGGGGFRGGGFRGGGFRGRGFGGFGFYGGLSV
jgi:uncharacterized membrane protein YgcG